DECAGNRARPQHQKPQVHHDRYVERLRANDELDHPEQAAEIAHAYQERLQRKLQRGLAQRLMPPQEPQHEALVFRVIAAHEDDYRAAAAFAQSVGWSSLGSSTVSGEYRRISFCRNATRRSRTSILPS